MSKLLGSEEEVKGQQFILMLDKAIKHGKMMNHWLDKAQMNILEDEAKNRHISVQDLIRVVILPDWFKNWRPKT